MYVLIGQYASVRFLRCSRFKYCIALLFALLSVTNASFASSDQNNKANNNLRVVRGILSLPENEIDLAKAKLTIDQMIDPRINIDLSLKQLDAMTKQVMSMLPANPTSLQKMEILVQYIYKAGQWNGNQAYQYDLNDPFGNNIKNKLLPTYIKTKRGNCISMPFLFIILGQRIGLDVTATTAPHHVFVKYRLEDGVHRNFEATSGGPKLDSSYKRNMPMTDLALQNGLYMQSLTKRETVAVMAGVLIEYYGEKNRQENRIALAKLALEYYPKHEAAMLHIVMGYLEMFGNEFVKKYKPADEIPVELRSRYLYLEQNMKLWHKKAEALGWRMPTEKEETDYLNSVKRAQTGQQ